MTPILPPSGPTPPSDRFGRTLQATETIDPFTTVDTFMGVDLPDTGVLSGTQLTLNIDNLTDSPPPFRRGGNGYGNGNVLGRVVMFGIRKQF